MTLIRFEGANLSATDTKAAAYRPTDATLTTATSIANASGVTTVGPFTNPGAQGAQLYLNVSAADNSGGSPTLDISVQAQDPVSTATWVALPNAAFQQVGAATSTQILILHPNVPEDSGTGWRRRVTVLPNTYRLSVSAQTLASGNSGSSYTFSVGATLIP